MAFHIKISWILPPRIFLKRKLSHCEVSCEASCHNFYVSFHNTYLFWSLYSIILSSLSFIKYSKQENFTDVSIIFLKYIFPQGFPRNQESWKNLFKKIYIRWVCVEEKGKWIPEITNTRLSYYLRHFHYKMHTGAKVTMIWKHSLKLLFIYV